MKNVIVAQSGGPTAVINASLAGVVDTSIKQGLKVFGALHGIEGVLKNDLIDLTKKFSNPKMVDLLTKTPSSYLGSCRYKLANDFADSDYEKIIETFQKNKIGYFFYIGGNDSMDTVSKLSKYVERKNLDIKIAGIPKTIDNDLAATDHTPGYGSAAKYIALSITEVFHDISVYSKPSVMIFEIMGRHAGWLTAAAALAKSNGKQICDLIYLPEVTFSKKKVIQDIEKKLKTSSKVVIAVSEGVKLEDGTFLAASNETDNFGHVKLSGAGNSLKSIVEQNLKVKVRNVEFSLLQRASAHIASETDMLEAFNGGKKGVELAISGKNGFIVCMERTKQYQIEYVAKEVDKIANLEKTFPDSWINKDKNNVTKEAIKYMSPLIKGEVKHNFIDGLIEFLDISHLK